MEIDFSKDNRLTNPTLLSSKFPGNGWGLRLAIGFTVLTRGMGAVLAAALSKQPVTSLRMCGSGMKWKYNGADAVLRLRSLTLTNGAWDAFWAKIRHFGI